MKLGTQTNSVMNHLMSRQVLGEPTPEVGMGVTLLLWTDRHAGTIQRIFTQAKRTVLEITEDKATLVSGSTLSEAQEYTFEPRPEGRKRYFAKDAGGLWVEMEYKVKEYHYDEETDTRTATLSSRLSKTGGGCGLKLGERDEYRDPSF